MKNRLIRNIKGYNRKIDHVRLLKIPLGGGGGWPKETFIKTSVRNRMTKLKKKSRKFNKENSFTKQRKKKRSCICFFCRLPDFLSKFSRSSLSNFLYSLLLLQYPPVQSVRSIYFSFSFYILFLVYRFPEQSTSRISEIYKVCVNECLCL